MYVCHCLGIMDDSEDDSQQLLEIILDNTTVFREHQRWRMWTLIGLRGKQDGCVMRCILKGIKDFH